MEKFAAFHSNLRKPSAFPMSSTEARTLVGTQVPRQPLIIIIIIIIIIITSDTGKSKL